MIGYIKSITFIVVSLLVKQELVAQNELIDQRDRKVYKTVKIGNQTWMAENLAIDQPDLESYCFKDSLSNCSKFGRLYTWQAAVNACPMGWRLPNKIDLEELLGFVGPDKGDSFKELIEGGDSGFNMRLGGYYFYSSPTIFNTSGYRVIENVSGLWSLSEEKNMATIIIFGIKGTVFLNKFYKKCALPVRCLKK